MATSIENNLLYAYIESSEDAAQDDPKYIFPGPPAFIDGHPIPGAPSVAAAIFGYIQGDGMRGVQPAFIQSNATALGGSDCFILGATAESLEQKGALRFNSLKQQHVEVIDNTNYDTLNGFTLNFYVKSLVDSNGVNRGIVVKEGVFETWVNSGGNSFGLRSHIGGSWKQALTLSFVRNQWYMLTMTYDGASFKCYRNGQQFYSINASGSVTDNNNPIYFGRYPSLNSYSDIDLAKVKFWNYSLNADEVKALWQPAFRASCAPAYICQVEPTDLWNSKRSVIVSDLSSTNPGITESTMGLCISYDFEQEGRQCFINAEAAGATSWDTRFVTDRSSYMSWDNVVLLSNNNSRFNEIQLGSVEYPITRDAKKIIRFFTTYDPGVATDARECWVHTFFDVSSSRSAFISTGTAQERHKSAFVQGEISGQLSASFGSYIVSDYSESTAQLYIYGMVVRSYEMWKKAYVHSYSDAATSSTGAHVAGAEATSWTTAAHIVAPAWREAFRMAFVMSTKDEEKSGILAFLQGNIVINRSTDAFMFGHFSDLSSVGAHIVGVNTGEASVGAFITSENKFKSFKKALMFGHQISESTLGCYLSSDVSVVGTLPSFIPSSEAKNDTRRIYIVGEIPNWIKSNARCYLLNTDVVSAKYAFIVSGPQHKQECYIVNNGQATRTRRAFIEGT